LGFGTRTGFHEELILREILFSTAPKRPVVWLVGDGIVGVG